MNYYTRKCNLSNNWIQFEIIGNIADMKLFEIDYSNFKLFCKLLAECIDALRSKNIKLIRQMVTIDDYNNIMKSNKNWKLIEQDNLMQTVLVECTIDTFLENFAESLNVHPDGKTL